MANMGQEPGPGSQGRGCSRLTPDLGTLPERRRPSVPAKREAGDAAALPSQEQGKHWAEEAVQRFLPFSPGPVKAFTTWVWRWEQRLRGVGRDPAGLQGPPGAT